MLLSKLLETILYQISNQFSLFSQEMYLKFL